MKPLYHKPFRGLENVCCDVVDLCSQVVHQYWRLLLRDGFYYNPQHEMAFH